jgi:thymidylate synthase
MEGHDNKAGDIPVISARGRTIPEAWEQSILRLWEEGVRVRTEYDRDGDEPSRDSTMVIVVDEPLAEPRIHLAFPGGIEDLEKYRQEVLFGVHDGWIRPQEGKWTYTYHQRLSAYAPVADLSSSDIKSPFGAVDQIRYIIDKLASSPHSRRAQGITWMPTADPATDDPPCLQRIWCRLIPVGEKGTGNRVPGTGDYGGGRSHVALVRDDSSSSVTRYPAPGTRHPSADFVLNMNSHWRSRDAYKAAFMNMYALTDLQRWLAEKISEKMKRPVAVGRYVDISDSYHIYCAYFQEFSERFLKLVKERPFDKRVWRTDDRRVQAAIKRAQEELEKEKLGRH